MLQIILGLIALVFIIRFTPIIFSALATMVVKTATALVIIGKSLFKAVKRLDDAKKLSQQAEMKAAEGDASAAEKSGQKAVVVQGTDAEGRLYSAFVERETDGSFIVSLPKAGIEYRAHAGAKLSDAENYFRVWLKDFAFIKGAK